MQRQGLLQGAIPAPQGEHVAHQLLDTQRVVIDDANQLGLTFGALLLAQQLGRLRDCGERVANFVGDAGGQPPQRRQLDLLRLCLHLIEVLQVNDSMAGVTGRPHNATPDRLAALGQTLMPVADSGRIRQRIDERGKQVTHHFADRQGPAEQGGGLRVGLTDAQLGVEHDRPVVHVLDNALVDRLLTGQIHAARARQDFVGQRTRRQQTRRQRHAKEADAHHANHKEIVGFTAFKEAHAVLGQHGHGRRRRIEQHPASVADQTATGEQHGEQHWQTTARAAADRHHQGQRRNIQQHLQGHDPIEAKPLDRIGKAQRQHAKQVEGGKGQEQPRRLFPQADALAKKQENRRHGQAEQIQVAQRAPACQISGNIVKALRDGHVLAVVATARVRLATEELVTDAHPFALGYMHTTALAGEHSGRGLRLACPATRRARLGAGTRRMLGFAQQTADPVDGKQDKEENEQFRHDLGAPRWKRKSLARGAARAPDSDQSATRRSQAASSVSSCLAKQKRTTPSSSAAAENADTGMAATFLSRVSHSTKAMSDSSRIAR